MKKLFALALTIAMVLAMGTVTAFAAEGDVKITVNTTTPEDGSSNTRTYNYYKIFNASYVDETDLSKGVSYYLNSTAEDSQKEKLDEIKIDDKDVFTFTKSADGTRWIVSINAKSESNTDGIDFSNSEAGNANAVKLAEELKKVVDANTSLFPKSSDFAAGAEVSVPKGYYLIVSSLGTKMILDTFQTQTVNEKNDYPGVDKKIKEGETTVTENDVNIGDTITYTVPITIPETVAEKDIVITDTMSKGLTLDKSSLTNDQSVTELSFVDGTPTETHNVYTVTIPAATVKSFAGKTLTLTYQAKLNKDAVVDGDGNKNTVKLTYDNYVTKDHEVTTKTYDFSLKKVNGSDADLTGAEFILYKTYTATPGDGETTYSNPVLFVSGGENIYRVADATETGDSKLEAGKIQLKGLDAGTYYLVETKAPDGYNLLDGHTEVTVSSTTGLNESTYDLKVVNNTGTELPSTGGIGTTIFYIVGGILVLGAGVLLITKKRMTKEG